MAEPSEKRPRVAILVTCADWRLHLAEVGLNARVADLLGVEGVDVLALPGPDGLMKPQRVGEWEALIDQISLLITAHAPVVLAVAGHQNCAGHAVDDARHDLDVGPVARGIKEATGFPGPIHAMMLVYRSDREWDLKTVAVI